MASNEISEEGPAAEGGVEIDDNPADVDPKSECQELRRLNERLNREVADLQYQLNEAKSEIAVAQYVKESVVELEREKTGLGEEMATLQQVRTTEPQL